MTTCKRLTNSLPKLSIITLAYSSSRPLGPYCLNAEYYYYYNNTNNNENNDNNSNDSNNSNNSNSSSNNNNNNNSINNNNTNNNSSNSSSSDNNNNNSNNNNNNNNNNNSDNNSNNNSLRLFLRARPLRVDVQGHPVLLDELEHFRFVPDFEETQTNKKVDKTHRITALVEKTPHAAGNNESGIAYPLLG